MLSRYHLLEHCWDHGYENRSNVVDVYVRYLREKIDRPSAAPRSRPCASRLSTRMSRVPVRLRLTLAFALAMAVVLAATGAFLYFRLQSSLDEAIDEGLQALSTQVVADVERGASVRDTPVPADERFVQVLTADGRVVDSTPQVADAPVLEPALAGARRPARRSGSRSRASRDSKVLAPPRSTRGKPGRTSGGGLGAAVEDRNETLRGFLTELLLIGPAALLAASLLGYGPHAALRPVEAMRAEAAAISGAEPGRRLRCRSRATRFGAWARR